METREEILGLLADRLTVIMGAGNYSEEVAFETLGLKSVNYSQLTTSLEDELDVEIPFMDFRRKKTIGEAADYLIELINE
jgi:acyl carrier protein